MSNVWGGSGCRSAVSNAWTVDLQCLMCGVGGAVDLQCLTCGVGGAVDLQCLTCGVGGAVTCSA